MIPSAEGCLAGSGSSNGRTAPAHPLRNSFPTRLEMIPESFNPYTPSTAVEQEASDARSKIDYGGLQGTEMGLRLYYYGIITIIVSIIAIMAAIPVFPPAAFLGGLGGLLGMVLILIGPFFCLTAPQKTQARGLIISSIAFFIFGIIMSIIENVIDYVPAGLGSLSSTVSSILFILFLIRLANYLERPDLSSSGKTVLLGAIIVLALGFGVSLASTMMNPDIGILMIVVAIAALIIFVMFANLINSLYKHIAKGRSGGQRVTG